MREIRPYGSEGGGAAALPPPILGGAGAWDRRPPAHASCRKKPIVNFFTASHQGKTGEVDYGPNSGDPTHSTARLSQTVPSDAGPPRRLTAREEELNPSWPKPTRTRGGEKSGSAVPTLEIRRDAASTSGISRAGSLRRWRIQGLGARQHERSDSQAVSFWLEGREPGKARD